MALSDLKVFSDFLYEASTEILQQQINAFNEASRGAINLETAAKVGDFSSILSFARVSGGLVRRRDAYGSGDVTPATMSMLEDVMVKVAAASRPLVLNPGQYRWINEQPEMAAAQMAKQLAQETLADMLNTAVGAASAAMLNNADVITDVTGTAIDGTLGPNCSPVNLQLATNKFGDMAGRLAVWVMHSKAINDYFVNALTNAARLFNYGSVNVMADAFGRIFIVSDIPALVVAGTPNHYCTLGLVPGAIDVDQQGDFDDNWSTLNGKENITRTYQSEWSYLLGIKGYAWDKTNGGKSPTDAALMTGTNWDLYSSSIKDTAGVLLLSK